MGNFQKEHIFSEEMEKCICAYRIYAVSRKMSYKRKHIYKLENHNNDTTTTTTWHPYSLIKVVIKKKKRKKTLFCWDQINYFQYKTLIHKICSQVRKSLKKWDQNIICGHIECLWSLVVKVSYIKKAYVIYYSCIFNLFSLVKEMQEGEVLKIFSSQIC